MKKELLEGLTKEQIEKVKACKNNEEILAMAKEEGVQLNDEQLEAVSGGGCFEESGVFCPKCGQENVRKLDGGYTSYQRWVTYKCQSCGYTYEVDRGE